MEYNNKAPLFCDRCGHELQIGDYPFCKGRPSDHGTVYSKTAAFPFDAPHITPDGRPIRIESMHHLRQIEKQYGVVLSTFSKSNERDLDPIKDLPKYRGDEIHRRK